MNWGAIALTQMQSTCHISNSCDATAIGALIGFGLAAIVGGPWLLWMWWRGDL